MLGVVAGEAQPPEFVPVRKLFLCPTETSLENLSVSFWPVFIPGGNSWALSP